MIHIRGHGQNCNCRFCQAGYVCQECKAYFKKNPDLVHHLREKHPKPGESPGLDAFFGDTKESTLQDFLNDDPDRAFVKDQLYRGKLEWKRSLDMNQYSLSLLVMLRCKETTKTV